MLLEDNILEEIRNSNNYNFIKGSVCNKEIIDLILKHGHDTIIHFAAQSHVEILLNPHNTQKII